VVSAVASIVFDTNPPIGTNTWTNRVGAPDDDTDPPVPAGCTAGDDQVTLYVCRVYLDVLGRAADTGGRAYWVQRLRAGDPRSAMAYAFLGTPESRRVLVRRLYEQYLRRAGEASGVAYWADRLGRGATPDRIRALILGSSEYRTSQGGGTTAGFVTAVYRDVFGRAVDSGGLAYWSDVVDGGEPRGSVAGRLLRTREGRHGVVADLYERFLRRRPRPAETTLWVDWFRRGRTERTITTQVIASNEYFAAG
jgi:hypothetical protein